MKRRAILIGFAAVLASTGAEARGMYCTRHPRACRERKERESERQEKELNRRMSLSPGKRAAEDSERARRIAEFDNSTAKKRADDDAARKNSLASAWEFSAIIAGALAFSAGVVLFVRRTP